MALVVRLRPGAEPELEIHSADLEQLDVFLRGMRAQGVWSALKGAAREFADAPLAGIEAVIQEALPGAQIISDLPSAAEPQVDLAAEKRQLDEWNRLATERAVAKGDIPDPNTAPSADIEVAPKQRTSACKTCGAGTTPGSGTGKNGYWEALFCNSGNRDHTHFINK